eukprot:885407-Rhodomonas_salina.1
MRQGLISALVALAGFAASTGTASQATSSTSTSSARHKYMYRTPSSSERLPSRNLKAQERLFAVVRHGYPGNGVGTHTLLGDQ